MSELPLRVLIQRADLDRSEKALLSAMEAHCSDGQHIYAFRERLAAWAKLSTRHVFRLIYGYADKRSGKRHKGLIERGVLTELVKARRGKSPARYRINAFALSVDPLIESHLERDRERARQMKLPGVIKPTKLGIPQQPVSDQPPSVTPCPMTSDTVSRGHVTPCPVDLKALPDLKALDLGAALQLVNAIQFGGYSLPKTPQLLQSIKGALEALVAAGKSPPEASDFLLAVTHDGISRGQLINRFWFEDAKWRKGNASANETRSGLRQATLLGNRDIARARIVDRRSTDDLS